MPRLTPPEPRTLLALAAPLLLAVHLPAQSHIYTFDGPLAGEKSGTAVAGGADLNRDGFDDILVGAPLGSTKGLYAGTARAYSGAEGRLLYTVHGDFRGDFLGSSVSFAGDVDRDGYPDFIAGAPGDDNRGIDSGSARLYSGKDGKPIRTFDGDSFGDHFGHAVGGAGDVNGDGYADVIVGAPDDDKNRKAASGSAFVFSGKDGAKLWEFHGKARFDNYGWSVAGAGDVDGDGNADLVIGTQQLLGSRTGYAQIRSGKTGAVLLTVSGTVTAGYLGWSVAAAGDVDRDGRADVIIGAYRETQNGRRNAGAARVYSGKTGKVLWTFLGTGADDELGTSVAGAGDLDADGVPDFVVGVPGDDGAGVDSGSVLALSGRTGRAFTTFRGKKPLVRFGHAVSGAGHVNSDRFADFVAGAPHDNTGGALAGRARALTWGAPTLEADRHLVSLSRRQSQSLILRGGRRNAGKLYFLIGSLSGIKPGISLGSLTLPLNLDAYMQITLLLPNSPLLGPSLGKLDAIGHSRARWTAIPQLPAELVGRVFHHAFVVLGTGFDFVSMATPVTLVK